MNGDNLISRFFVNLMIEFDQHFARVRMDYVFGSDAADDSFPQGLNNTRAFDNSLNLDAFDIVVADFDFADVTGEYGFDMLFRKRCVAGNKFVAGTGFDAFHGIFTEHVAEHGFFQGGADFLFRLA